MYNLIKRKYFNKTEYWLYKESIKEKADRDPDSVISKYRRQRPRSDPDGFIDCDDNPFDNPDYEIDPSEFFDFVDSEFYKLSNFNRVVRIIYDLALSNEWFNFVTLTFDPDKVDSFNYEACCKAVSSWLNALRHRYSYWDIVLCYLGVPELHKSGRYHFHFLFGYIPPGELKDSGKYSYYKGKKSKIYNWSVYDLGFSTVIKVYKSEGISKYLCKYITKSLLDTIPKGKKKYWCSRNLNRPVEEKFQVDDLTNLSMQLSLSSDFATVINFPNCINKKYIYSLLERKDNILPPLSC